MLVVLAIFALAVFAGAILFTASHYVVAVPVHLAFAVGAMPLIGGAMLHFVPVLTRSAPWRRGGQVIPGIMLLAGALVFTSFIFPLPAAPLRDVAATFAIVGAGLLSWRIIRVARKSLDRPHPGVWWYLAALICLLLGLMSVLLMHAWPEQYAALRRFHMHINTVGFIGITAVGTLQVLLPTAVGLPDPTVGLRLRKDVKWVFAGTLLIATGAAWLKLLVWPGLVMWLVPLVRLTAAWIALYRKAPAQWSEAATGVAGALLGFMVVLLLGTAHAGRMLVSTHAPVAYLFAFLLPLVTGAVSYLLPLWVRPGSQTEWHRRVRQSLARFSGLRVLLFIVAGVIAAWSGSTWAVFPAVAALLLFAVQFRVFVNR